MRLAPIKKPADAFRSAGGHFKQECRGTRYQIRDSFMPTGDLVEITLPPQRPGMCRQQLTVAFPVRCDGNAMGTHLAGRLGGSRGGGRPRWCVIPG